MNAFMRRGGKGKGKVEEREKGGGGGEGKGRGLLPIILLRSLGR